MSARSTDITFTNGTAFTLYLHDSNLDHGEWGTSPPESIGAFSSGTWSTESDGFMTGDQGSCSYSINKDDNLLVTVGWDNPFAGGNSYSNSGPTGYSIGNSGGSGDNASITYTFGVSSYPNWMSNLSSIIKSKPLNEIMLPGTHDSGTYGITGSCRESPDRPQFVAIVEEWLGAKGVAILTAILIPIVGPVAAPIAAAAMVTLINKNFYDIIAGWGRSQEQSILEQLNGGIRYLDLRVAYNPNDSGVPSKDPNHVYICHGLYSVPLTTVLNDVKTFLSSNTQEIVILDINHVYNFNNPEDLAQLAKEVTGILGTLMAPSSMTAQATFDTFIGEGKQAVVLLDSDVTTLDSNFFTSNPTFWSDNDFIESKWPEKTDISELVTYLENELTTHTETSKYWVLQGILTEGGTQIANGLVPGTKDPSNLLEYAKGTTPVIAGLVSSQFQNKNVNIIIADYYNCTPFYVGNIIKVNGETSIKNTDNAFLFHDVKDSQLKLGGANRNVHGDGHWNFEPLPLNKDVHKNQNFAISLSVNGKDNVRKYVCGDNKTGKVGLCPVLQTDGSTNWILINSKSNNGSVHIICMHGGIETYLYGKVNKNKYEHDLKLVSYDTINEAKSDEKIDEESEKIATEWTVDHISKPIMLESARSAELTFMNLLSVTLGSGSGSVSHGTLDPSPPSAIDANKSGKWANNSGGFMTGAQGSWSYKIGDTDNIVNVSWDTPFIGSNSYSISVTGPEKSKYYTLYTGGSGTNATVTYQISSLS